MATYTGKAVTLNADQATVYARLSDLSHLESRLDSLPPEIRAKAGEITFTPDSIAINAAPAGKIVLTITERRPDERVVLTAENSPIPLSMTINIAAAGEDGKTIVSAVTEVDIPAFARPFVGPKMQEASDKFGEMLQTIFNGGSDC